ncbi:MAG: hypothetical protein N4A46_01780, partial [Schleiferiaceae bacterium]|nr:hypothetical protein [Schleiferiaceae bacterium]
MKFTALHKALTTLMLLVVLFSSGQPDSGDIIHKITKSDNSSYEKIAALDTVTRYYRTTDPCLSARANFEVAEYYYDFSEYDSSIINILEGINLVSADCDSSMYARALLMYSYNEIDLGEIKHADSLANVALNYFESHDNKEEQINCLNALAICSAYMGSGFEITNALFRRMYHLAEAEGNPLAPARSLLNIGATHGRFNNVDSAIFYYQQVKAINSKKPQNRMSVNYHDGIAGLYSQKG